MTDVSPAKPRSLLSQLVSTGAHQRLLAFASLVVLLIGFSLASPNFMQTSNMIAILQASSVNGVLAIAATLVIITGGIDLSVGTLMTFTAVIAGVVLTYAGLPLPLGVIAAIGAGALSGLCSGAFVAKMKIPPFIATLGMMLILKGLSLVISGTRPIYFNDTPGFDQISRGSLIVELFPALPIPNGVLILFLVAAAASYILSRTVLGRYTFALGSNEEAVRLSGVNTDAWKMAIYALAGGIVGLGGLLIFQFRFDVPGGLHGFLVCHFLALPGRQDGDRYGPVLVLAHFRGRVHVRAVRADGHAAQGPLTDDRRRSLQLVPVHLGDGVLLDFLDPDAVAAEVDARLPGHAGLRLVDNLRGPVAVLERRQRPADDQAPLVVRVELVQVADHLVGVVAVVHRQPVLVHGHARHVMSDPSPVPMLDGLPRTRDHRDGGALGAVAVVSELDIDAAEP
ncbi:hypothetical protein LCGC14_1808500 [marine sediment metagenome]|uniref:Inner-membrane translocator n=1 Tax=marine sediment metagenome TaxID=412755 RepID=A0A0F9J263_9ZZZZ